MPNKSPKPLIFGLFIHFAETFTLSRKFKKEKKTVLTETQTETPKKQNPCKGLLYRGSILKVADTHRTGPFNNVDNKAVTH